MNMKKMAAGCLAALLMNACQTGTTTTDNKKTADSTFNATPFMSADAALLDVRGNVKRVTVKTTDCDEQGNQTIEEWSVKTFVFDKKKHMKQEGDTDARITRNEHGQITCIDSNDEDEEARTYQYFAYDEQGDLKSCETHGYEWEGVKTFHYDERGDLSWTEEKSGSEGVTTVEVEKFKILERDTVGNWTVRLISTNCQSFDRDGEVEDDGDEDVRTYGLEVREIVYKNKSLLEKGREKLRGHQEEK